MKYRIYADGTIYDEDLFSELDSTATYYDDFKTIDVPDELVEYIEEGVS